MTEPRVHDRAASLLDDGAESEAAMQRVWHRVKDAEPRAARRFPRPIAAAGAVAALALGVLLAWPSGPTPPLRLAAGTELRPSEAVASQLVLAFDDGSRVQLQAGSSLTPVRNEGEHIAFRLPAGRAHFDVVPGGPRTWEVQTPRFRVRVLGTSFSVEASDERSAVRVERGRVAVEDVQQGTVRTLGAGEEWIIEQDPPAPPPARTADESFEPARNEPSEVATDERPEIAEERRPRSPTAATDVERAEAEVDVLTLVDEARRRGDTSRAVELLERFLSDHHADTRAPLAAITLGRIERRRGNDEAAANAYGRARRYALPTSLAAEACAEEAAARARAGDSSAHVLAGECLGRAPNSPYSAELRRLLRGR